MMTELLVPIDFSDATPAVLQTASQLAKSLGAHISLLHVLAGEGHGHRPHGTAGEGSQVVEVAAERPEALEQQGHALGQPVRTVHLATDENLSALRKQSQLQCHVDALRAQGLNISPMIITGKPVEKILAEAARLRPAYLVLGSHGHGALHHLLLGGVTEGVLRKAPCPMVIVPCRAG